MTAMNMKSTILGSLLVTTALSGCIWHLGDGITGDGYQTGIVTAVQTHSTWPCSGTDNVRWDIWLLTTLRTGQAAEKESDHYALERNHDFLADVLRDAMKNQTWVRVHYVAHGGWGPSMCDYSDQDAIDAVEAVP